MILTGVSFVNFIEDTGIAPVLHDAEIEIAHQQGGGEPAYGQKHGEYKAFNQNTHVYDERYIVPFVKEIEIERLQDVFLAPGHHRRVYEVENPQRYKKKGQCPAEIASEISVPEVYHKSCQLVI